MATIYHAGGAKCWFAYRDVSSAGVFGYWKDVVTWARMCLTRQRSSDANRKGGLQWRTITGHCAA